MSIKAISLKNPSLNKNCVSEILANYIYDPTKDGEYDFASRKRVYANPTRADYSTKATLMEASLKEFIEQEVWKKLDLLTVVDYKDFSHHLAKDIIPSNFSNANEEDVFSIDLITKFSSISNPNSKLELVKNTVFFPFSKDSVKNSCKIGFFATATAVAAVASYYALNYYSLTLQK